MSSLVPDHAEIDAVFDIYPRPRRDRTIDLCGPTIAHTKAANICRALLKQPRGTLSRPTAGDFRAWYRANGIGRLRAARGAGPKTLKLIVVALGLRSPEDQS